MGKTAVYLSDDIVNEIKSASQAEGRSEEEIVRDALEGYFERRHSGVPAIFGTWSGGTIGGANSEDWLQENWHPE